MNQSFTLRAGFMPVITSDYFRPSLLEKGAHIVQHIFNVEELRSGLKIKTPFLYLCCYIKYATILKHI